MYDYDWQGIGLLITTPAGNCWLQGEEAASLYDRLEALDGDEAVEQVLSDYESVCE